VTTSATGAAVPVSASSSSSPVIAK
jgi:hypothetical protein